MTSGNPSARTERVRTLMAAMAAGDTDAIFAFEAAFAPAIARNLRRIAEDRGATLRAGEVDELVREVVLDLAERAAAWRPDGGALPWRWARHRLANLVDGHLGQWATPIEEAQAALDRRAAEGGGPGAAAPLAAGGRERAAGEVAASAARREPLLGLYLEALHLVASPRDVDLLLEELLERGGGNPAPAEAVARANEVAAATVRKQKSRVIARVRRLAATEARFAPLADLAVQQPARSPGAPG